VPKNESEIKLKLKRILENRPHRTIKDDNRRASAVLIPLYFKDGQFYVLFTKRTELVHHHKGEISFPGGGFHPDDGCLRQTALRESQEEIGLASCDVEVLGQLDDFATKGSPFIISPFVGVFKPDHHYIASAFEIAEIITIPVDALLQLSCRESGPEVMPGGDMITAYIFTHGKYRIVGATARILNQFLDIFSAALCSDPP
jgi:8-oxo-dGTP pyrophosphatase MutT (NUDIX family)